MILNLQNVLYNSEFDNETTFARTLPFIFKCYVFCTKNVQTSQKTCHAFQQSNVGLQAMIFHENKVKLSVTSEKFPKIQLSYNERITFKNFDEKIQTSWK